jgi:hypothetical protein
MMAERELAGIPSEQIPGNGHDNIVESEGEGIDPVVLQEKGQDNSNEEEED